MLLAESIAKAAKRWLLLLRNSTFVQAAAIIRADPRYTDLTKTQYATALEWLAERRFLLHCDAGYELALAVRGLSLHRLNCILFERIVECAELPWIPYADALIPDVTEVPQDAAAIAAVLDVEEEDAYAAVMQIHGRIDLARRAQIGAAGETALISHLEGFAAGSTTHVAEYSDGFGFDIIFRYLGKEWNLEVKSTLRGRKLTVYISRHEFEVGTHDPRWRLVLVVLGPDLDMQSCHTVNFDELIKRAPTDVSRDAQWQSAAFQLTNGDIDNGLDFIEKSGS